MTNSVLERSDEARAIVSAMRVKQPDVARPPGPNGLLSLITLASGRVPTYRFFAGLARFGQPVVHMQLGRDHVNVLFDPETIWEIFVTNGRHATKSLALQLTRPLLGDGLLTAEGSTHLQHRRAIQPLFHNKRIASYVQDMNDAAEVTSGSWSDGLRLDIAESMSELTLDVIGRTIFGLDLRQDAAAFAEALDTVLAGFSRGLGPLSGPLSRLPSKRRQAEIAAVENLDRLVAEMIDARRQAIAEGHIGNDLLTMLLTATNDDGEPAFNSQEVRDEAMTLVLAGHETTALTLTWSWHLLSHNPEQAAWLREELDSLPDRPLTSDDLRDLPRTYAVVAESMRLHPPAWIVGRWLKKDMRAAGWDLPKGSTVLASQFAMHRDPRFWPAPLEFVPQRWIDEEGRFDERVPDVPRGVWFPFGFGGRRCIGEHFAWTEAVVLLATLAKRWDVQVQSSAEPAMLSAITLRPADPMPSVVRAR